MATSEYKPVSKIDVCNINYSSWKTIRNQLFICIPTWTVYFMNGLVLGAPTVSIPQIRKEANSTEVVSEEMATWLTSVFGVAGTPWVFILAILMELVGRKISVIVVVLDVILGTIVVYCSNNVVQMLIGEIILGVIITSTLTVLPVLISEYTSPKYRGVFLAIKSASSFWGIWVSNAIGTFFYWKNIFLLMMICAVSTFAVLLWPESPYWLASKGRFDEAARSHRWLKGSSSDSEKELENMIDAAKFHLKNKRLKLSFSKEGIVNYFKSLTLPEFYKPLGLCLLILCQLNFCGKMVFSSYAVDILKKMTENEAAAYRVMLILDGATIISMYIGCIVSRYVRRRLILISTSVVAIFFLFITSFYLYLIKLNVIQELEAVSVVLLMGFSISIGVGPMILSTTLYGEIIPLRFRGTCVILVAIFLTLSFSLVMKISPYVFKAYGLHVGFLLYGVISSVLTFGIYIYMPETKDRTLQEIEEFFKASSKSDTDQRVEKELKPLT